MLKYLYDRGLTVVLDLEDDAFMLIQPKAVHPQDTVQVGTRGKSFISELSSYETIYLYDARSPPGLDVPTMPPLDVNAHTFVTASPSRGGSGMNSWLRKRNIQMPAIFYMPPWSLDELLALRKQSNEYHQVSEDDVSKLFMCWGGSVRACLRQFVRKPKIADLESNLPVPSPVEIGRNGVKDAVKKCNPEVMLTYLNSLSAKSDKMDTVSHSLLLLIPFDNFRKFSYSFCSDLARDEVLKKDASEGLV